MQAHHMRFNEIHPLLISRISIYGTTIRFYIGIANVLVSNKIGFHVCLNHFMRFSAKHSIWNGITVKYHWDNGRICALCCLIKISKNHWIVLRIPPIWNREPELFNERDCFFFQFSWSAFWLNCQQTMNYFNFNFKNEFPYLIFRTNLIKFSHRWNLEHSRVFYNNVFVILNSVWKYIPLFIRYWFFFRRTQTSDVVRANAP